MTERLSSIDSILARIDELDKQQEEFVSLLLAVIQADQNPRWHKEEWEKLWDSVKNSKAKKLGKLKDQLAKKIGK